MSEGKNFYKRYGFKRAEPADGMVVIGGSAGALPPILEILRTLPPEFVIPIVMVMHRPRLKNEGLTELIASRVPRSIREPDHGERIRNGFFYLAPPGYHLLIDREKQFLLSDLGLGSSFMPSIDELFETAAEAYGKKAIAVLLSGAGNDGVGGLVRVTSLGGKSIVQHPSSAEVSILPREAIRKSPGASVMHPHEIAAFISENGSKQGIDETLEYTF